MALDLTVDLYLDDEGTGLWLEDTTGLYSAGNTGGYNSPNAAIADVTTVTATLTYTQLSTTLVYVFTVSSGTITAATSSLAGATGVDILSELPSTTWPFTSANPFELTADYGVTLPSLEDAAYTISYRVQGSGIDYTATDNELVSTAACCCISKALATEDINNINETVLTGSMRADAYLKVAQYALDSGDTSKANDFLIKAQSLCDCGCSDC